jgi:hypothetical protein
VAQEQIMPSDPFIDPDHDLWNCLKQAAGFGAVALLLVLPPATLSQLRPVPPDAATLQLRSTGRPANLVVPKSGEPKSAVSGIPPVSASSVPSRPLSSMV